MGMKWEYINLSLNTKYPHDDFKWAYFEGEILSETFNLDMNTMGSKGWEAYAISTLCEGDLIIVFFKRPIRKDKPIYVTNPGDEVVVKLE